MAAANHLLLVGRVSNTPTPRAGAIRRLSLNPLHSLLNCSFLPYCKSHFAPYLYKYVIKMTFTIYEKIDNPLESGSGLIRVSFALLSQSVCNRGLFHFLVGNGCHTAIRPDIEGGLNHIEK